MKSIEIILARERDIGTVAPQRYCAIFQNDRAEQVEIYDYSPALLAFSLRESKIALANIISYESGQTISGGWNEVSETEIKEFQENSKLLPYLKYKKRVLSKEIGSFLKKNFKNLYKPFKK